jgi:hypothetical protein
VGGYFAQLMVQMSRRLVYDMSRVLVSVVEGFAAA